MESPDQPRDPWPSEASSARQARPAARPAPPGRLEPWRRTMRWVPAVVFALALAVRLAYTFEIRDLPTLHELVMDAQRYDELAHDILDHGWRPRQAFYQAPLYPYLLAAVYAASGRSPTAMRLAQALVGALTAVLTAVAGGRLWQRGAGDEDTRQRTAAAAIAGVLAALYAPAVFYTPLLLKTVPVLFLESAALVLLLPPSGRRLTPARALAAGSALGGAALLQESLLLLTPAAALSVMIAGEDATDEAEEAKEAGRPLHGRRRRQRAGAALALLAGAALALAPAALFNHAASGEVLLTSSQGGMNFYIGNARGATGTYLPLSSGSQMPERQRADAQRLAALFASRERGRAVAPGDLEPGQVSRLFWRETWREIAADPGSWVRLLLRKLRLFWNAYELPDAEGFRVYRRESLLLRCDPVVFGMVAPLAAVGLLALGRGCRHRRRGALLLALLAAAVCAAVTAFFVFGRYRLAVVPFLLPLAAAGVLELVAVSTRARAASFRAAARPALDLALLAAAGLAVGLPCFSAAQVRQQDAVIEYNLGVAASRWSAAAGAESLRLAAGAHGQPSPAEREILDRAVSRASRAIAYLEEAARASPEFLAAEIEWAIARERRGAYRAAAGAYAQAAADFLGARERREAARILGASEEQRAAAMTPGASKGAAGDQSRGGGSDDPELAEEAGRLLASLDARAAAALNNLGVQLIAAGQLDRAEATLTQAAAIAPDQPEPRGSLSLCWYQRGLAARQRGAWPEAARLFAASHDGYQQAVRLAEATGRADLADLYRGGQAAAEAELAREPQSPGAGRHRR